MRKCFTSRAAEKTLFRTIAYYSSIFLVSTIVGNLRVFRKIQMSCAFLECLQLMICFKVPFFKTGSRALDQNRAWFDRDKPEGMFQSYSLIIHLLFKFTSFAIEIALQSAVQYEIVFGSLFH